MTPITRIANHKVDLVDMMLNLDILSSVSLLSKAICDEMILIIAGISCGPGNGEGPLY